MPSDLGTIHPAAVYIKSGGNWVAWDGSTSGGGGGSDTELPAAAALADGAANPTTPTVGSAGLIFNGTTWDRLRSGFALADAVDGKYQPAVCLWAFNGATWDRLRLQNVRKDMNAVAIGSIATVWTPASGKKFRLMGGSFSVSAAVSVLFEDNAAGAGNFIWRSPKLAADTPYNFDLGQGFLSGAVDRVLKATSSAAANITGTLYGTEES